MTVKNKWSDYGAPKVTVQQLDDLMEFVTTGNGAGKIAMIVAMCKIIIIFLYLYARMRLISHQNDIENQRKIMEDKRKTDNALDNGVM